MKKVMMLAMVVFAMVMLMSCGTVVEPNKVGVLMENYGKNGKSDFSVVKGRVFNTFSLGSEVYQVPMWEQRADFESNNSEKRVLHLKASDNTEFTSKPLYSYKVNADKAVDIVFDNKHLGNDGDFLKSVEDNILETKIYDLMKEESRKYSTDELMATGGSLKFEEAVQKIITTEFASKGFVLMTFSCQLEFSAKVKAKIDNRNEVNTNISVIDQQIAEQKKQNELAELIAQENIIKSKGLTPQILQLEYIKMLEKIKQPIYGNVPITLMKN